MTDHAPDTHQSVPATGPLALKSNLVLGPNAHDVARESVDDALMIVESYGPWGADLNDAHRRQIVLADEVLRLRGLYEMAVRGRAEMRSALRQERRAEELHEGCHQDKAIQLAREAAVDCEERHSYMPPTPLLAEDWMPHRWVIDAMLSAAYDAEQERDRYRAGNTQLIEALMRFAEGQPDAGEFAQPILAECGMLNGSDGTLNWAALEARRPKQQTWAEAVNECVADPAERARLLAMGDAA